MYRILYTKQAAKDIKKLKKNLLVIFGGIAHSGLIFSIKWYTR